MVLFRSQSLDKLGNWEKVHFGFLSHLLEMVPMGWDDTT